MTSKILLTIQIVTGVGLLIFGLGKFIPFMPASSSTPEAMQAYKMALVSTGFMMKFVGLVQIISGLSFILNKYVALTSIAIATVMLNAVLAHLFLDIKGILPASIILIFIIIIMIKNKEHYKGILEA